MYIDYSTWETFEYSLTSLSLDLNNPRIKYRGAPMNQSQIMKYLIEKEKVYELAKKISEEGYFVGEEPIICIENNKKVVLEGNRRTAALKLLQNPKKFLSNAKTKILLQNILKNNFPVDKKLRCYIAPNRLLANPIIYERHQGDTLKKWETGNQYAFVAEMYYDGLNIEDICEVLNESRAKVLKPLKAYNLFLEGQDVLEKETGIKVDISDFEITNLERFYNYEDARLLLGIDFNNENGELIINLPREEFEKRLLTVFNILLDSERFSRDFNKDDDKVSYIEKLKANSNFNFDVDDSSKTESKSAIKIANLEEEKSKTTTRKKKRIKSSFQENIIIPREKEIIFDNEKLDSLFYELKSLPIKNFYSFAILLRSYLEQSLYFYIEQNKLMDNLNEKANRENEINGQKKINSLISHLKETYKIDEDIQKEPIINILKFNNTRDYSNASLKLMLDYVKNHELNDHLNTTQLKSLKHYIDRIKDGLDLAVHNLYTTIDSSHNIRAWSALEPLFDILSNNVKTDN